jgi:hypothetical protein
MKMKQVKESNGIKIDLPVKGWVDNMDAFDLIQNDATRKKKKKKKGKEKEKICY